jgi:hypothetical protein
MSQPRGARAAAILADDVNDTNWSGDGTGLGRLPLVVGVTGHRDLREQDREALAGRVRHIFMELRARYRTTPLVLLSPLAEGADRLVARVALDCGVRLVVPLPLPQALYEEDFSRSDASPALAAVPPRSGTPVEDSLGASSPADAEPTGSLAEFSELLGLAEQRFELPLLPGYSEDDLREPGGPRDQHYAAVGAHVAQHSQLLIALWDGVDSERVGSTAQVVRFQLEGVPEPYVAPRSALDPPDVGPVYQIVTPRRRNPHPAGDPLSLCKHYPHGYGSDAAEEAAFHRICARLDDFNRDAARQAGTLAVERETSKISVLGQAAAMLPPAIRALLDHYATADTLALYYQRRTLRTVRGLFVLAFVAACCFALYADFPLARQVRPTTEEHWGWGLGLYLGVLGGAFLLYGWAQRRDYQNKYQDYRALAEGLRVQLFWAIAGVDASVAEHYLRKQKGELNWIRGAVRTATIPLRQREGSGTERAATLERGSRLQLVLRRWVEAQREFFTRAAVRDQARRETLERGARRLVCLGVGIAVGVAVSLAGGWGLEWLIPTAALQSPSVFLEDQALAQGGLIVLMALPLVAAGTVEGYVHILALAEQAKQYQRMGLLFANAEARLTALLYAGQHDRALDLIRELGKEALVENGDWVLLHRERPLEVPT